jgi:DnaJ-class molecular chaperone
MNKNKNYYNTLGVNHSSTKEEIKKTYYKLSFKHHPDKGGDEKIFNEISEAYKVLTEQKEEYDKVSKFGKDYNEIIEFFSIDIQYDHKSTESKFEKVKNREILDIYIDIEEEKFNGVVEYSRFITCKKCKGSGKDFSSKIHIKDKDGNIVKTFDGEDGCDMCEGTGKDDYDNKCYFCHGVGKIGSNECITCKGERRILGKQKAKNIKLTGDETRIKAMGNHSYYDDGKCGDLIICMKKSGK